MKILIAAVLTLVYGPLVSAQVCNRGSAEAKFECARAGDEFATAGDFNEAKKAWKISCDEGLQSSCEAVQTMTVNLSKFKAQWNSDPINQSQRTQNLPQLKCKTDKSLRKKCLAEARFLDSNNESQKAASILKGMCDAKVAEACFELGGIEVRSENLKAAVKPYMKGCSLGHSNSCSVLSSVQADLHQNEARQLRIEAQRKEESVRKQKEAEQTVDAVFATVKILSGKPTPKLRCKTKKTADGESETECFE